MMRDPAISIHKIFACLFSRGRKTREPLRVILCSVEIITSGLGTGGVWVEEGKVKFPCHSMN